MCKNDLTVKSIPAHFDFENIAETKSFCFGITTLPVERSYQSCEQLKRSNIYDGSIEELRLGTLL